MPDYVPRSVDPLIERLFGELPALFLVGPRATGKTTTGLRHANTVLDLSQVDVARAVEAHPDSALRDLPEPVLIDEWQLVPEVLGAMKRTLDRESRPARYLVTGSVRADIEGTTWPGTGRLVRVPMYGLTVAEQLRGPTTKTFFERLLDDEPLRVPDDTPDLRGYIELALRGGFPEALDLSDDARARWLESYIDQLVTRDAQQAGGGRRDPAMLRRYFEALALNSAGVVEDKVLYDSVGITRQTAVDYEQLLINLRVVEKVPAWTSNRFKRLVRSPKRYVVDPALMAGALGIDVSGVMRSGELVGRVIDTFVTAQLRAELPLGRRRPRLYHLRDAQGRHEIDLVAEIGGQQVIGMEIKADAAPRNTAARHLVWFRDRMGEQFLAGVLFHTGSHTYPIDDRIVAAPISTIWG